MGGLAVPLGLVSRAPLQGASQSNGGWIYSKAFPSAGGYEQQKRGPHWDTFQCTVSGYSRVCTKSTPQQISLRPDGVMVQKEGTLPWC